MVSVLALTYNDLWVEPLAQQTSQRGGGQRSPEVKSKLEMQMKNPNKGQICPFLLSGELLK